MQALASKGRTVVHVAIDGRPAGLIAIADPPRETARAAVAALRELGIRPVMLTGDTRATAARIAFEVGIEEVLAEVLPGEKAAKVAELQAAGRKVAMVGDGVNDAPALVQAEVGIAIGAGTDVAIETADVVLMRSDPLDVATAVTIGRGIRKMRQNLGWAIGYKSLALPIAAGLRAMGRDAPPRDRCPLDVRLERPRRRERTRAEAAEPSGRGGRRATVRVGGWTDPRRGDRFEGVISVREGLARRLDTRGLAAVAVVLVVMLVLLVGVHPLSDDVVEHADLVCAAAVLVLGLAVSLLRREQDDDPHPAVRDTRIRLAAPVARPALRLVEARSLPLRR